MCQNYIIMNYIEQKLKESLKQIDNYTIEQYLEGFMLLQDLYLKLKLEGYKERYCKIYFCFLDIDDKYYSGFLNLEKLTIHKYPSDSDTYADINQVTSVKLA